MFLNRNYVLGNELVKYLGVTPSLLSMARKDLIHNEDYTTILKLGGTVLVNGNSRNLPSVFQVNLDVLRDESIFTNMSNKLPIPYVSRELQITRKELNIIGGKEIKIGSTRFWEFEDDFVKKLTKRTKKTIPYILDAESYFKCLQLNQIEGGIMLKPNKYFTWYFV